MRKIKQFKIESIKTRIEKDLEFAENVISDSNGIELL
jgi:hypothetical protein